MNGLDTGIVTALRVAPKSKGRTKLARNLLRRGRWLHPVLPVVLGLLVVAGRGPVRSAEDLDRLEQEAFVEAVGRVAPSVVRIETIGGVDRVGRVLFGTGPTTGLVVDGEGYIVSAAFNFLNKPSSILVELPDGTRKAARLVATDHNRMLVLLKVDVEGPLPVPEMAPVDAVEVGAWAIAVGRAFERSQPNVAVGIVSAKNRIWGKAIQTDAAVSPNNYGGPLVDIRGRVLGVLVPLSPEAADEVAGVQWYDSGIGFAIPATDLQEVLPRLKEGQDLYPGLLGISFGRASLYTGKPVIAAVRPNSPAFRAGLEPGDEILQVGDRTTTRAAEVNEELSRRYAGQSVRVVVKRDDATVTAEAVLVAELEPYAHPFLGVLPLRVPGRGGGVGVRYVYPEGPAAKAGIEPGDRIVQLGEDVVEDGAWLRQRLSRLTPGDEAVVGLRRGEAARTVSLVLGRLPEEPPEEELPPAYAAEPGGEVPAAEPGSTGLQPVQLPEWENKAWVYLPGGYRPDRPHGLLVWLPPPGPCDPRQLASPWEAACDRDRLVLLVAQSADAKRWFPREADLVRKLIDQIQGDYAVDEGRIVIAGQGAGGTLACQVAVRNREVVRGVAVVAGPLPGRFVENEPLHRLAFFVARTKDPDSQVADRTDAAVALLRRMNYPVCLRNLGPKPRALEADEIAELARWIDSLDKI